MATKQLSDGRTEGAILGQSTSDKIGFYGTSTPVAKQTLTLSAALTAGSTTPADIAACVDEIHAALSALGIIA